MKIWVNLLMLLWISKVSEIFLFLDLSSHRYWGLWITWLTQRASLYQAKEESAMFFKLFVFVFCFVLFCFLFCFSGLGFASWLSSSNLGSFTTFQPNMRSFSFDSSFSFFNLVPIFMDIFYIVYKDVRGNPKTRVSPDQTEPDRNQSGIGTHFWEYIGVRSCRG